MPEPRRRETLGTFIADIEKRIRNVEALAAVAAFQTVGFQTPTFTTVTSGSFVPAMHANYPFISQPVLNLEVTVSTDPGTTAEVRLSEFYSGAVSDALAIPAGGDHVVSLAWLHGVHLTDEICEFRVDARRTAGAGVVRLFNPRRILFDDVTRFPGASTGGNPALI